MPRARVDPQNRRRVPRACDVCRRRKEKCDGNLPCGHCRSRNKGHSCRYAQSCSSSSNPSRNRATGSRTPLSPSGYTLVPEGSSVGDNYFAEVDALLGLSASADPAAEQSMVDSAPISKQSRMLPDAKGKLSSSTLPPLPISLTNNRQSLHWTVGFAVISPYRPKGGC